MVRIALAADAAPRRVTETGLLFGTSHSMPPKQGTADRDLTGAPTPDIRQQPKAYPEWSKSANRDRHCQPQAIGADHILDTAANGDSEGDRTR